MSDDFRRDSSRAIRRTGVFFFRAIKDGVEANRNLPGVTDYEAVDLSLGILLRRVPRVPVEREQSRGEHDCEIKVTTARHPADRGPIGCVAGR